MTFIDDITWLKKEKYAGIENGDFFRDVKRLENGEPLAYIIGNIPFLNTNIYLDSHPLIPRPETEYWVEQVLKVVAAKTKNTNQSTKILDLCAGSGCVGVAVAKNVPVTTVDFIELDRAYLPTITKNCKQNDIAMERVEILTGDLRQLEQIIPNRKYDFILSNPPYIDKNLNRTAESVTKFEPALALYGGAEGLELIRSIIEQAPKYLLENGQLWLEHEPEQANEIAALAIQNGFTFISHKDQFEVIRFSQLVLQ